MGLASGTTTTPKPCSARSRSASSPTPTRRVGPTRSRSPPACGDTSTAW
jgi:hypothetical protein